MLAGVRILRRGDADRFPVSVVRQVQILTSPVSADPRTLVGTFDAIRGDGKAADLWFRAPVEARYLRIVVQAFEGAIAMRAGLYMAGPPGYTAL